jgi:hypothetical protein
VRLSLTRRRTEGYLDIEGGNCLFLVNVTTAWHPLCLVETGTATFLRLIDNAANRNRTDRRIIPYDSAGRLEGFSHD